jgi:mono/diheme cytochrome c family protein
LRVKVSDMYLLDLLFRAHCGSPGSHAARTSATHSSGKIRRLRWLVALFIGIALQNGWPALAQQGSAQSSPPFDISQVPAPTAPPLASSGHAIYQENCAPCHGPEGKGDGPTADSLPGPPTPFADPDALWERSPAQLFHTTKFGRLEKLMPPWRNRLDDAQIWQAVAYAWSLHTSQLETAAGAELYQASCASCHGERGAGDGAQATVAMPNLGDPAYAMARSQADWATGWRTAHAEIGAEWSSDDARKVLEFIRTFSYVPPWASPYRPGDGIIRGQIVQPAASSIPLTVSLVSLEAYVDFQRVAFFTATADTAGQFQFENLAVDPGIVYMAAAASEGISYSSPVLSLAPETPVITTTIRIFGQTDDATGVTIDRAHWIIDARPGALLVAEIYQFGNRSDRTFVGTRVAGIDAAVTLALQVPAGAQEISFQNGTLGDRFRQQGSIIYDTTPVVPGDSTRQIVMQYVLPYAGEEALLTQEFRYPVAALNLLVADLPQLRVSTESLTAMGPQDIQGNLYQMWQGQNLQPGAVAVKLSGLLAAGAVDPRTAADSGSDDMAAAGAGGAVASTSLPLWAPWFIGILCSAMLAGVFTWSWRQGSMHTARRVADLRARRAELVQQIARLDDRQALGQIDAADWRQTRSRLKVELLTTEHRLIELSQTKPR